MLLNILLFVIENWLKELNFLHEDIIEINLGAPKDETCGP
jgi:hypothetical protein